MNKSILQNIILALLIISSFPGYSQTDTTKLESLEIKVTNLQKNLDEIKKIVTNDTVLSYNVGTFKLFKVQNIEVYHYLSMKSTKSECNKKDNSKYKRKKCTTKELTSLSVNIEKVIVEISDGVISDIQVVTTENKTFTNGLAPIEVNQFNERCDLLKFNNGNELLYIQTCDFMTWVRNGNYIPNDTMFELKEKDESKSLTKDVDMNSIFNVKLYSDMLSAFGDESNGLVQTEVNFKTPLISSNIKNKPFFLFHYFKMNFRLARFDNKFRYTNLLIDNSDTIYTKSDITFSRQTLHKRSFLNLDIGLNVFSGKFGNKSKSGYALDLFSGFSLSNFASSTDSLTVSLPYIGLTPSIKIIAAPNLGVNLSSQIIWQYAPQLKSKGYGQKKEIISPEIEFYWNPLSSPGNKIFARAKYVIMSGDNNPFWQLQFGYNLSFSEIINKKLDNE